MSPTLSSTTTSSSTTKSSSTTIPSSINVKKKLKKKVHVVETCSKNEELSNQVMNEVNHSIALGKKWTQCDVVLDQNILHVIHHDFGFLTMSPVQENTIPLLLSHKDVVAEACTGSGKTLAYLIPIFELLLRRKRESPLFDEMAAIVVCPTRELARQVYEQAIKFGKRFPQFKLQLIVGGVGSGISNAPTEHIGNGKEIIAISTPGRLLDTIDSVDHAPGYLSNLEVLILDEADRILDMGMEQQVTQILQKLPKQRRTGLFSATQTTEMKDIIRSGLRNPVKVKVEVEKSTKQSTPKELLNYYMFCGQDERLSQLIQFLIEHHESKVIVYFLTCACVSYFMKILPEILLAKKCAMKVFGLHGKMVQKRRTATHREFMTSETGSILVCTDVAARGLDFPDINYIVQYDPPQAPSTFVHRVGRTARMGKKGVSLIFLSEHESAYVELLKVKRVPVEEMKPYEDAQNVLPLLRETVLQDRDLVDKASEAFISFVRAYKEHQCNYIFKLKELEFDKLVKAYCLLQKPNIWKKEFKKFRLKVEEELDIEKIPYKDPRREKARLLRMKKLQEERDLKKEEDEEEVKKKNETLYVKKLEIRNKNLSSKRKRRVYEYLEEEDLKNEAKLLKKLKQGKITEEQYEELTGEVDFERSFMKKQFKKLSKKDQTEEDDDSDVSDSGMEEDTNLPEKNKISRKKRKQNH